MKQLPQQFIDYTRNIMGAERFDKFLEGMDGPCPNTIRVNMLKVKDSEDFVTSNAKFPTVGRSILSAVPWCPDAYYLPERPNYTFDPLLHAGCYYVQEASSMFVAKVLAQYVDTPVVMLDMCAAPGGKTTTAMGVLPEGSVVVSNEPVRLRANILAENVQKWGFANNIITNNYPHDYARSGLLFDVILCDVPCSGEGMFRKDDGAVDEWSVANVEKCRNLQRDIVTDAWNCLKAGGLLIYSTCTYNIKENEENVKWLSDEFGAELMPVGVENDWNITGSLLSGFDSPVYRFIPGISRGEGLFMAVLRKPFSDTGKSGRRVKPVRMKLAKFPQQWISNQEFYNIYQHNDRFVAVHKQMEGIYAAVSAFLNIVHAGITLGEQKGKDIIPQQSLALSTALLRDAFPAVELTYEQAIAYLRKETVILDSCIPRGFVLVTYKNIPLGFVKNIGNRTNNLYPQEWKIRKSM